MIRISERVIGRCILRFILRVMDVVVGIFGLLTNAVFKNMGFNEDL